MRRERKASRCSERARRKLLAGRFRVQQPLAGMETEITLATAALVLSF
jgi:hypothetical protein